MHEKDKFAVVIGSLQFEPFILLGDRYTVCELTPGGSYKPIAVCEDQDIADRVATALGVLVRP